MCFCQVPCILENKLSLHKFVTELYSLQELQYSPFTNCTILQSDLFCHIVFFFVSKKLN